MLGSLQLRGLRTLHNKENKTSNKGGDVYERDVKVCFEMISAGSGNGKAVYGADELI